MAFYDLNKEQRQQLVVEINNNILADIQQNSHRSLTHYFADDDTYIRKTAYLAIGKVWKTDPNLRPNIILLLQLRLQSEHEKVRQTVVNAAGEIGIMEFEIVEPIFNTALFDQHPIVINAVIGSIKKMGEKNPIPVLEWAKQYLHHPDKEVRRAICHGIELRGRTHPQDILPLLKVLQFDKTARVRNTLIHVLGQIAYKKGCLETVVEHLKSWDNQALVGKALNEIVDVHYRYENFAVLSPQQAQDYIDQHFSSQ